MADKTKKNSKNIPGMYYVDSECIGCGMCHEIAPDYFKINEEEGFAFVGVQPGTQEDRYTCDEAMNSCPVEAIGDDGE